MEARNEDLEALEDPEDLERKSMSAQKNKITGSVVTEEILLF